MGHNSLPEMLFIGALKLNQISVWSGYLSVLKSDKKLNKGLK